MIIKRADITDIEEMTQVGRRFYDEAGFGKLGLKYDELGFGKMIFSLLQLPNILVLIAKIGEEIIGSIAASAFPWVMDPSQLVVQELWWWVNPEHRGISGIRLIKSLEKWCEEMGAKHLVMVGLANDDFKKMDKLYGRLGFNLMEMQYHKGLSWQ